MNEPPRLLRETPQVGADFGVRDARVARILGRPVVSWAITMGLGGLFLGFIGATDSYQYALSLRLVFWLSLCAVGGVIAITIERAMVGFGLRAQSALVWWALLSLALAIAMVPVIFLVNSTGSNSPIADLPIFAINSLAISAALTALRLVIGAMMTRSGGSADGQADAADGQEADVPVEQSDSLPKLLARLRPALQSGQLLALKAEGHYLKVYTDQGSELILMRLKDAVEETAPVEGMQVHRSWWLARQEGMERRTNTGRLELKLDEETWVPVSRTYRAAWRGADW